MLPVKVKKNVCSEAKWHYFFLSAVDILSLFSRIKSFAHLCHSFVTSHSKGKAINGWKICITNIISFLLQSMTNLGWILLKFNSKFRICTRVVLSRDRGILVWQKLEAICCYWHLSRSMYRSCYVLYSMYYALWTMYHTLWTMDYVLCTMYYALCTLFYVFASTRSWYSVHTTWWEFAQSLSLRGRKLGTDLAIYRSCNCHPSSSWWYRSCWWKISRTPNIRFSECTDPTVNCNCIHWGIT